MELAFSLHIRYNGPAKKSGGLLKWSKRRDSKTCDHFGSLSRKCPDFSRLPRHRAAENFPVFSPRFLPNFRAVSEIRNTQFNMQRYRSGHNENDSKSFGRPETGPWVRIPPAAPHQFPRGNPLGSWFFIGLRSKLPLIRLPLHLPRTAWNCSPNGHKH